MIDRVIELLRRRGAKVAAAESCTGGRIASAFTARAGASEYFLGGVVAYSNDMKTDVLGVSREALAKHGAVSGEVAEQMALGMRLISGADYAVATTGIAGPGGGSAEKPVGTVWIAVAGPGDLDGGNGAGTPYGGGGGGDGIGPENGVISRLVRFDGAREQIMAKAVAAAIELLKEKIEI